MYACDRQWWRHHIDAVKQVFNGELVTQYGDDGDDLPYAQAHGITAVPGIDEPGLGRDGVLRYNSNSGAQAIQVAVFRGAERVVLLGFDMQNTGGRSHWFGDHPENLATGNYASFIPTFTKLADDLKGAGVEVINCTRTTALTQFPRAKLCDVL